MFNFDFGKSLMKQVEAYLRLSPQQRGRRQAPLIHQLETYAKRYMMIVANPGTANPGLLKNGAEALLEAATALGESKISYATFAEMVSRSRKVPVVPGLAALVDRLLEIPSEMKAERAAMLSWRITTGSMRPERLLAYLAERAQLTGDAGYFRDYASQLAQLVKRGTIGLRDEAAVHALEDLLTNKPMLGDRTAQVQLMAAQCLAERKNYRQAEELLIELATEAKQLPEGFLDTVAVVIDNRPDASWELHQAALVPTLESYSEGRTLWTVLLGRLDKARPHDQHMVDFLLNYPTLTKDEKLARFTAEAMLRLDPRGIASSMVRWRLVYEQAGVAIPDELAAMVDAGIAQLGELPEVEAPPELPEVVAVREEEPEYPSPPELLEAVAAEEQEPELPPELGEVVAAGDEEPERPELQQGEVVAEEAVAEAGETAVEEVAGAGVEQLEDALAHAGSPSELTEALERWCAGPDAGVRRLDLAGEALRTPGLPGWAIAEGRLWIAEQLMAAGESEAATLQLAELEVEDPEAAGECGSRIEALFPEQERPERVVAILGRLRLACADYAAALSAGLGLADDDPTRAELLTAIQERLAELSGPTPEILMVLARARRAAARDPQTGFEAATTASLLAPEDEAIQQAYREWTNAVPAAVLHRQRAKQATYLCAREGRESLLAVALAETEALGQPSEGERNTDVVEWLEQLRPFLEAAEAEGGKGMLLLWTRLYLMYVAQAVRREAMPLALVEAMHQVEPEAVLAIVGELGQSIPVEVRQACQWDALIRMGAWAAALDVALGGGGSPPWLPLPVEELLERFPGEALLSASERIAGELASQGDDDGRLRLVKYLGTRCRGGNGEQGPQELVALADRELGALCDGRYQPAVRYRLQQRGEEDLVAMACDLIALAMEGDGEAVGELEGVFGALASRGGPADVLQAAAEVLADSDPALALPVIVRTGQATGNAQWALAEIDQRGLEASTPEDAEALGRLALSAGDHPRALRSAAGLVSLGARAKAREMIESVLTADPGCTDALVALITLQMEGEERRFASATANLLRLAQLYADTGARPADALAPIKERLWDACEAARGDDSAEHAKLAILVLTGEFERAAQLVRDVIERGPEATAGLLLLFEKLALEDADLPSPLVVAWGRALFAAGRTDDALSRLAGLREAVEDYPEYIALLEEIKEAGGGAGAAMQLGEGYLRVHLWQRSAEEYASALAVDPALAEPILTQLRHHAALDPNPMKYPLHLLGLKATAESSRQADWGWALSALTWLAPRWSAEELHTVSQALWQGRQRGELSPEQETELLLQVVELALKLGQHAEALECIAAGWETAGSSSPDLRQALRSIDPGKLPEEVYYEELFWRLSLDAAVLDDNQEQAIRAAGEMAKRSPQGREAALAKLAEYGERAADPLPVVLARLRFLDTKTAEGREVFVKELLRAAESELPADQARTLISTVLDLVREAVNDGELARLLLLLFRQFGDQSRAWQLALCHLAGDEEPGSTALDILRAIAHDEYALAQKVALLEVYEVRGESEAAAALLDELSWAELGEHAGRAAGLAEALIGTPQSARARRWLISHYRETGQLALAADHLVWAHIAGNPQPAEWLFEQRTPELLLRAAEVHALQDNMDAARKALRLACKGTTEDRWIAATMRHRLSELLEQAGELEEAHDLAQEAARLVPERGELVERQAALLHGIAGQRIAKARQEEDSPQRTLSVARLLREIGQLNDAITELQEGFGRGQTGLEIYIELAECFIETGEHAIGRRAYLEVFRRLEQGEGDTELRLRTLYGLAAAEENLGNTQEAVRYLEQLLLLRREYRDAKARLGSLQRGRPKAKRGSSAQPDEIVDEILSLLGIPPLPADKENDEEGRGQ